MTAPQRTILVVDDDANAREGLAAFLQEEGFTVQTAADGREGLDRLREGLVPDAILLDLHMPGVSGPQMHDALLENPAWSAIPIILITGAPKEAVPLEAEAVVAKPFDAQKLVSVVRDVAPSVSGQCRLMLVEDDESIRETSAELLRSSGYTVVTAPDGQGALEHMELGWVPDVIITDLVMPRVNGGEFLFRLKQKPEWSEIPIIVASGATSTLVDGMTVDGIVSKPIDYRKLTAFVNRAFARTRRRQARKLRRTVAELVTATSAETVPESPPEQPRLTDSQRADGRLRFFASVAHELKTPLQVLTSSTQLLQMSGKLGDRDLKHARAAQSAAQRMSRLVEDLLEFLQVDAGAMFSVRRERGDLAEICQATVEELRTAHPTRKIELTAAPGVMGLWDQARMAQIVTNLVSNALKYGDGQRPVEVTLEADEGSALLRVANHGPPIPLEAVPSLFDPFKRAVAQNDRRPGLGLGLAIVRQIAFAHGGAIDVESADDLTTFSVVLPLV